jgi:hypothetical protein
MSRMLIAAAFILMGCIGIAESQTGTNSSAPKVESQASLKRVLGEVSRIDPGRSQLTVKTTSGDVTLQLDPRTIYRRVLPGETTLDKAVSISLSDINTGDKVLARGPQVESSLLVRELIVIANKDLVEKRKHDREEWIRRGITGVVTSIDAEKKELTVRARLPEGEHPMIMPAGTNVAFRRYSGESIRYSDSRASSFTEVKVGDQLRALGEKTADGTHFTPEEVIFGTFRTVVGRITSVNPTSGEVVINNVQTNKPMQILVNKDSSIHRLSHEVGQQLVQRVSRGATGASEGEVSIQRMIENLPPATLGELKPGDAVLVSTTVGDDANRATAIEFTVGADDLAKLLAQPTGSRKLNLELGLPSGVDP